MLKIQQYFIRCMDSTLLFVAVLFINIATLFMTDFFPSLDGPAHLYNANILFDLVSGSSKLSEFYDINTIPIPNWLSHVLIVLFRFLAPAWLAEKMLLVVYLGGLSISFRLLIKELSPNSISFTFLIFPFSYSFLFYLGFYNYCLSFIFFFLSLWLWLKYSHSRSPQFYILLGGLISLTYFSNVLLYVFLGFTLGCYILYGIVCEKCEMNSLRLKNIFSQLGMLFLISIPSLVCFCFFYLNTQFVSTGESLSSEELIKWIQDVRLLIIYSYLEEEVYTRKIGYILCVLFFIIGYQRLKVRPVRFKKTDVILIPLLVGILLYFVVPDSSSAGMMSIRYAILIFMLFIAWLSTQYSSVLARILIVLILCLSTGLLLNHNTVFKKLNKDAVEIYVASKYIKEGSIVLPVNLSDHWMQPHFSNYLGVDKPIVILENYEVGVGWFPVIWNSNRPNILLDEKEQIEGVQWMTNSESDKKREIDYIFIYGNLKHSQDSKWVGLKKIIHENFKLVYRREKLLLFERINL